MQHLQERWTLELRQQKSRGDLQVELQKEKHQAQLDLKAVQLDLRLQWLKEERELLYAQLVEQESTEEQQADEMV